MGCIAGSAHLHGVCGAGSLFPSLANRIKQGRSCIFFAVDAVWGEVSGQRYMYMASDFSVEIHRAPTAHIFS